VRYLGLDIDFAAPRGEPSLSPADSVAWRVFKNPVALYIGGVTAVLLELAEPRVRTGVWEHTNFRDAPVRRMRRTGIAAMVTVYAARSQAEAMIERVARMHGRVEGTTPCGQAYSANDPELLTWVHATASYGFLSAYDRFADPLDLAEQNRFYSESSRAAALYGADAPPRSVAQRESLFEAMHPRLEASAIIGDFLEIAARAPALPFPFTTLQRPLIRASIHLLPEPVRARLELADTLSESEALRIRQAARVFERIAVPMSPPVQACRRLGLSTDLLYRSRRRRAVRALAASIMPAKRSKM